MLFHQHVPVNCGGISIFKQFIYFIIGIKLDFEGFKFFCGRVVGGCGGGSGGGCWGGCIEII